MRAVLRCIFLITIAIFAYLTLTFVHYQSDRASCVCSFLSTTEQTYAIDERLYRVCEKDTMSSGTFLLVRTTCNHGMRLQLTVMPDEGIFKGYIVTNNETNRTKKGTPSSEAVAQGGAFRFCCLCMRIESRVTEICVFLHQ